MDKGGSKARNNMRTLGMVSEKQRKLTGWPVFLLSDLWWSGSQIWVPVVLHHRR